MEKQQSKTKKNQQKPEDLDLLLFSFQCVRAGTYSAVKASTAFLTWFFSVHYSV